MSDTSPPSAGMSGLSIAAAVCGGVSLVFTVAGFCCSPLFCMGTLLALAGVVLGFVSRGAVQKGEAGEASGIPAMVGIVTGALGLLGQLGLVVVGLIMGGLSAVMGMLGNM